MRQGCRAQCRETGTSCAVSTERRELFDAGMARRLICMLLVREGLGSQVPEKVAREVFKKFDRELGDISAME